MCTDTTIICKNDENYAHIRCIHALSCYKHANDSPLYWIYRHPRSAKNYSPQLMLKVTCNNI